MQVSVIFDKQHYLPNETVIATFRFESDISSRARKVTFGLVSGEKVAVQYTSGVGKNRHRHTARVQEIYNIAKKEIPIDELQVEHRIEFVVPDTESIRLPQLHVFNEAFVDVDIKMGSDEHYKFDIPIVRQFMPVPDYQGGNYEVEGLKVQLKARYAYANDILPIKILPPLNQKYRGIRVELEQRIQREARGHRGRNSSIIPLMSYYDTEQPIPPKILLPALSVSSQLGIHFNVEYNLKVVLDIRFAADVNIVIPFYYLRTPHSTIECALQERNNMNAIEQSSQQIQRGDIVDMSHLKSAKFIGSDATKQEILQSIEQTNKSTSITDTGCPVCGYEFDEDSVFCPECGTMLERE